MIAATADTVIQQITMKVVIVYPLSSGAKGTPRNQLLGADLSTWFKVPARYYVCSSGTLVTYTRANVIDQDSFSVNLP